MKLYFVLTVLALLCINNIQTTNLDIGNTTGAQLVYLENVSLSSIPFFVREKTVFFNHERNQPIKAISVRDLDNSNAKVRVTAGGVGSIFANIELKSQRGSGLNYQVQIFA